jgi:hypothetical protein
MKWLLQNVRRRAAFALKNPRYVANAIVDELAQADEKFIGHITRVSHRKIRAYMDEPIATPDFAKLLRMSEGRMNKLSIATADLFAKKVLLQYAAARALAPECIVETGIANGVSSAYLLLAIRKNGKGQLHSIELGDPTFLPAGTEPGWLVPTWLRGPWQVHIGDARRLLPPLLSKCRPIEAWDFSARARNEAFALFTFFRAKHWGCRDQRGVSRPRVARGTQFRHERYGRHADRDWLF